MVITTVMQSKRLAFLIDHSNTIGIHSCAALFVMSNYKDYYGTHIQSEQKQFQKIGCVPSLKL